MSDRSPASKALEYEVDRQTHEDVPVREPQIWSGIIHVGDPFVEYVFHERMEEPGPEIYVREERHSCTFSYRAKSGWKRIPRRFVDERHRLVEYWDEK